MKTIKTYEIPSFEIQEITYDIVQDKLTGKLVELERIITHKMTGLICTLGEEVYFGYTLHFLPPYPSMETDPTFQGSGQNPQADDKRFYLRKGTDRERPIKENGEIVGVEEYYQKHCKSFFNYKGVTYIQFDPSFAGGAFKRKEEFFLENKTKLSRSNRKKATIDAKFPDLSWI